MNIACYNYSYICNRFKVHYISYEVIYVIF